MKRLILITIVVVAIVTAFYVLKDSEDEESKNPVAKFTPDRYNAKIYENETGQSSYPEISFNASESTDPDGEITNYYWEFGDGNFTTESNPNTQWTYQNSGKFEVNLTVTDNDENEIKSESVTITINYHKEDNNIISSGAEDIIPFPVNSEAEICKIVVNITYSPPNSEVEISVYDPDKNQVGDTETKSGFSGNDQVEITLSKSQFNSHGYGKYKLKINCTQGSITYDSTIDVNY